MDNSKNELILSAPKEIKCSRIVGYNLGFDNINWMLLTLTDSILYTSDIYGKQDTWSVDLNTLDLEPGTQFNLSYKFSDNLAHVDSSEILIYTPDSNATVYYQHDSGNTNHPLVLNGIVPPIYTSNAESYLKSSGVSIKTEASVLTKYAIYTLDGVKLYESDRLSEGDILNLNFKDIPITPKGIFKIKALVIAGKDDVCDVTFQYIPDSYYIGNLDLIGGTLNNTLAFKGSHTLIPSDSKTAIGDELMIYNNSNIIAKFAIILLDGTIIYQKEKQIQWDMLHINLNNLDIEVNTYVRLKVILMEYDVTSNIAIKYLPGSATAYYTLTGKAGVPITHSINYYGVLSAETTPPLIKCSSIKAINNSRMITKWTIISSGTTLFLSNRCGINKSWLLNFDDIALAPGTRFLLKSNAVGGKDAIAYVTIEYDDTIDITANFNFVGNAFKTILIYEGSK